MMDEVTKEPAPGELLKQLSFAVGTAHLPTPSAAELALYFGQSTLHSSAHGPTALWVMQVACKHWQSLASAPDAPTNSPAEGKAEEHHMQDKPANTAGPASSESEYSTGACKGTSPAAAVPNSDADAVTALARRSPQPTTPSRAVEPAPALQQPFPRADLRKLQVHLKNARAGEAYRGELTVDGLSKVRLIDAANTGLIWKAEDQTLTGTPSTAGDFRIIFGGLIQDQSVEVIADLAVIPDPKSLWVSKPSDRGVPFWKSDEDFGQVEGQLLLAAASKRGRSHAREGGCRDDDFGLLWYAASNWHIGVVADGAGSARFSRRGSQLAVETVLAKLPLLLDEHLSAQLDVLVGRHLSGEAGTDETIRRALYSSLAGAAFQAARAVETEAQSQQCEAAAFYTTLIIGVCRKTPQGWFFAAFGIGDGGAAVFSLHDACVIPLTLADGGEFAGQTRFLQTSEFHGGYDDLSRRLVFCIQPEFTVFALMTDGITDPKFPTDVAFADLAKWGNFWNDDLTLGVDLRRGNDDLKQEFLAWMDFWSPGNHDDRTLAVMVP